MATKTSSAKKILSDNMKYRPVAVKQTKGKEASQEILLTDREDLFQLNKCEDIDVEKIQNVAIKTQGGAGPLGMDLYGWKSILTSKQFG